MADAYQEKNIMGYISIHYGKGSQGQTKKSAPGEKVPGVDNTPYPWQKIPPILWDRISTYWFF